MKWLNNTNFDQKHGKIMESGNRIVMVAAGALKALRDTATEVMKVETADSILYLAGKRHTKEFVSDVISDNLFAGLAKRFNWGKEKITEKVMEILSQYGYGFPRIKELDFDKETIITLEDSCIASQYKSKQKNTVCSYIAGLLAGGAEAITGGRYDCFELQCAAKGDKECRFVIEKA